MSLELPRLPQFPPSHEEMQIWWQQVCEAIEAQEATQDTLLTDLSATQAELAATQSDLSTTVDSLEATQAALTATQADLAAVQTGQASLITDLSSAVTAIATAQAAADAAQASVTALENGGPYVVQNVGPAWAAPTGTADRTTFATYAAPTISAAYVQAEVQAIANGLQVASRHLKAVIDDLIANGALT